MAKEKEETKHHPTSKERLGELTEKIEEMLSVVEGDVETIDDFEREVKDLKEEIEEKEEKIKELEDEIEHPDHVSLCHENVREENIAKGLWQAFDWAQEGKLDYEKLEIIIDKIKQHVEKT